MAAEQFAGDWPLVRKEKWPVAGRRRMAGRYVGRDWPVEDEAAGGLWGRSCVGVVAGKEMCSDGSKEGS